MTSKTMGLWALLIMLGWIHPSYAHSSFKREILYPKTSNACAVSAVYHEGRGVKSKASRIELARSILSRVGHKEFGKNTCSVIKQKTVIHHHIVCQFSWECRRQHIRDWDPHTYNEVSLIVNRARKLNRLYGPIKATYFTSNNTCPVPSIHRYKKGPFTFCIPRKPSL